MAIFKCKMCGGETTLDTINGIAICEYCGTKQALPLFTEDSERLLYESGNNYIAHSEYDKAENVFNQLLTIKPNAAELYWDLVLCKYGVTYVKDPKTDNYIPTCNRTHYTPIFSDANYLKAIQLSSGEKKALFENDAKTIDEIQKGIIAVSKKEKPFDIFISYKETDANGNRTKDSVEAQKLYEKLTEAGYKVFFSRITLEDKVGTEYEPYIYAALYSSKIMLAIGSSNENFEAVWVKNEWARYLGFRQNDNSKTLIPLYFDMAKSELPDDFAMIPSFNIKEMGFEAELLRGIKKQIPLPIMLAQKRKARKKALLVSLLSFLSVAVVCGAIFLPSVIKEHKYGNSYEEAIALFENQKYKEAKDIFNTIPKYKDSKYMIERCDVQPKYDAAMQLYYEGNYPEAAWAFAAIKNYEDAADQQKKAELSWRRNLSTPYSNGEYITENGTAGVDISKNGKVISIIKNGNMTEGYEYPTILYENGVVSHSKFDNNFSSNPECHDIIKISETFRDEIIGLRADGKMIVLTGDSQKFEGLSEWENIIDFEENFYSVEGDNSGLIIGLKTDGTLCAIQYADFQEFNIDMNVVKQIIKDFKNVKKFAVSGDCLYDDVRANLKITAVTKDNKLLTYVNGKYSESNINDVCHIASTDIVLKSNGDLVSLNSDKVLLKDVVHCGKNDYDCFSVYYAVSRNGNVYSFTNFEGYEVQQAENKTIVYDEWISRLN